MRKLLAVVLLMLTFSFSALGAPAAHAAQNRDDLNKNLALVGGGMLGVVLASGAVGLISASSMMYEGAGFAEALESGAGLSLPVGLLTAVLGAVFGQDFVLRNINNYSAGAEPPPGH
ncbi:conserved membrane hypothetical protein [Gammaproteobacteria bacterium]